MYSYVLPNLDNYNNCIYNTQGKLNCKINIENFNNPFDFYLGKRSEILDVGENCDIGICAGKKNREENKSCSSTLML